ncbi:urease accessory protein UreF [Nonomuraea sp. NEAU-A123]|uniref:urease accessory protein UreF n=1 Tax=Nonomuraea sp. NEAU-A123 TaxID=2839649 RepID=UPI001BE4413C|nr:urease accessory UreF family protein [Nonomuraea sp. NEAU-A123]MBT2229494.1 urease accessory protein UreF [Nonomuraea sp. NEAU-A123]
MNPALLLLTDSRLPAGGHAHSGGTEQAIATGAVHDLASLAAFLRGRLHTSGHVAAALAAAACTLSATRSPDTLWDLLDAEADARTASPAQRDASRTQGRLLLRVARRLWPSPALDGLAQAVPNPHHPIALGAAAHAAGASPEDAALAAAYHAITGSATAAVRLLGLDPVAVHGLLADLAPDLAATASMADMGAHSTEPPGASGTPLADRSWAELPARSAPALDLLAERHAGAKVRLFVS